MYVTDFFDNLSGDPNCDVDKTTCVLKDLNCGAIMPYQAAQYIIDGVIYVDTDINIHVIWFCVQCTSKDGTKTV